MKPFASNASRTRALTAWLRAGGIVGVIASLLNFGYRFSKAPAESEIPVTFAPATMPASRKIDPAWLAVLAARPLREKAPAVVTAAPAVLAKPTPPPQLELVGTMVNPGQTARAFVRSKAASKLITVQEGKEIDGAIVKSIADGQVTLEFAGKEFVIRTARKSL
jgi:hypothetical protein